MILYYDNEQNKAIMIIKSNFKDLFNIIIEQPEQVNEYYLLTHEQIQEKFNITTLEKWEEFRI